MPEIVLVLSLLARTRRHLPVSESSISEQSMMDRLEMMTCNAEQVVNRTVDTEKPLGLSR